MIRLRIASASVVTMLIAGCAAHNAGKPVASAKPQGPVIVRLVGQHQAVTVTSGPNGPLYSAETIDGKTIVANATLEQLRVDHPEVYQFIEPGVAVDASLESRPMFNGNARRSVGRSSDLLMLDSRE